MRAGIEGLGGTHAYGDAAKVPGLVAEHGGRIRKQIDLREEDEAGRLEAEYQSYADKLAGYRRLADEKRRGTDARRRAVNDFFRS